MPDKPRHDDRNSQDSAMTEAAVATPQTDKMLSRKEGASAM